MRICVVKTIHWRITAEHRRIRINYQINCVHYYIINIQSLSQRTESPYSLIISLLARTLAIICQENEVYTGSCYAILIDMNVHFLKQIDFLEELTITVGAQDISFLLLNKLHSLKILFDTNLSSLTLIDCLKKCCA
jgi:hypothetical protein